MIENLSEIIRSNHNISQDVQSQCSIEHAPSIDSRLASKLPTPRNLSMQDR